MPSHGARQIEEPLGIGLGRQPRHERLAHDVLPLEPEARLAQQDQELARHVLAAQVLGRVRLGVAALVRLPDRARENGTPDSTRWSTNESVPERTAETPEQPVARRRRSEIVPRTGRAAPTVVS